MWRPRLNFIVLHYAYIISLGILGLLVFAPYGNVRTIDAYFFGVSASTESGLNPVDLKDLKTYQQLFVYFIPMVSNIGFINIMVVCVRLFWFEKRLKEIAPSVLRPRPRISDPKDIRFDPEVQPDEIAKEADLPRIPEGEGINEGQPLMDATTEGASSDNAITVVGSNQQTKTGPEEGDPINNRAISFGNTSKALYIPSPRERDRGHPIIEVDIPSSEDDSDRDNARPGKPRRRPSGFSIDRATSLTFAATPSRHRESQIRPAVSLSKDSNLPGLSSQATLGRNSQFFNLTTKDRERLGGVEYRSLKLLLKIICAYFFGLHAIGAICLIAWIQYADPKYRNYLDECGQNKIWWAIYSAQTMTDNLGFTLTPDSMVTFSDAVFPIFVMTVLAYCGYTLYPCVLRLIIWLMYKWVPEESSLKEPLSFLLNYPRRCYMLLFRSRPTWILFGIMFALNFIDILLILLLDLNNPAVNTLPAGKRIMAAIFQAASSRHTGTATFNLADVNPAVQFSLLVMMYISVFPLAISVRASNIYEEKALGIYSPHPEIDENDSRGYLLTHMRNQLSFDLWYIFLGIFCICASESGRITNPDQPGFTVFAIFFESVSAYGNVGLSLGYPGTSTSFCAQLSIFSKLVLCTMMVRGRHRAFPSQLDRAILLPSDRLVEDDQAVESHTARFSKSRSFMRWADARPLRVQRYWTQ